jgi:hypothetical protein
MKKSLIFILYFTITQTLCPAALVNKNIEKATQTGNQENLDLCLFQAMNPLCSDQDLTNLLLAAISAGAKLHAQHPRKPGLTLLHAAINRLNSDLPNITPRALHDMLCLGLNPNISSSSTPSPLDCIDFQGAGNIEYKRTAAECLIKAGAKLSELSQNKQYLDANYEPLSQRERLTKEKFQQAIAYVKNLNPGIARRWNFLHPYRPLHSTEVILKEAYKEYLQGNQHALDFLFKSETITLIATREHSFTPEFLSFILENSVTTDLQAL